MRTVAHREEPIDPRDRLAAATASPIRMLHKASGPAPAIVRCRLAVLGADRVSVGGKEHARSPSHPVRVPCGRRFHGSREVDADHYTATIWCRSSYLYRTLPSPLIGRPLESVRSGSQ
jgi:hypothetical protein